MTKTKSLIHWLEKHWVSIFGVCAALLCLVLLTVSYHYSNQTPHCFARLLEGTADSCRLALREAAKWPGLLLWSYNFLSVLVGAVLIGAMSTAYRYLTSLFAQPIGLWRIGLSLGVLSVLTFAGLEHGENFWLLAQRPSPNEVQLKTVAVMMSIKYWAGILSVLLGVSFGLLALRLRTLLAKTREDFSKLLKLDDTKRVELLASRLIPEGKSSKWPATLGSARYGTARAVDPTTLVWRAVVFERFLRKALSSLGAKRLRYSFPFSAVEHWLEEVGFAEKLDERQRHQLREFLVSLSKRGFIAPRGRRFVVMSADLTNDDLIDIAIAVPNPGGDSAPRDNQSPTSL